MAIKNSLKFARVSTLPDDLKVMIGDGQRASGESLS
jgi:hypothetical protein